MTAFYVSLAYLLEVENKESVVSGLWCLSFLKTRDWWFQAKIWSPPGLLKNLVWLPIAPGSSWALPWVTRLCWIGTCLLRSLSSHVLLPGVSSPFLHCKSWPPQVVFPTSPTGRSPSATHWGMGIGDSIELICHSPSTTQILNSRCVNSFGAEFPWFIAFLCAWHAGDSEVCWVGSRGVGYVWVFFCYCLLNLVSTAEKSILVVGSSTGCMAAWITCLVHLRDLCIQPLP